MGTMCVPGAPGGQKRALDPMELELSVVVRHHVEVLGTASGSSRRADSALNPESSFQPQEGPLLKIRMIRLRDFMKKSKKKSSYPKVHSPRNIPPPYLVNLHRCWGIGCREPYTIICFAQQGEERSVNPYALVETLML